MMLRTIFGHPAIAPLRRVTKQAWWRYKGRTIVNPPVPAGATSVLFVCLGNICRSPFAEVIAVRRVASAGGSIRFSSAGLRTKQAAEPPVEARRAAATFGVSLDRHRPQELTQSLIESHDLIVVMEPGQRDLICAQFPRAEGRVFLLSLFDQNAAGMDRFLIADPFGLPASAFEECYRRIDRSVSHLLSALGQAVERRRAC